VAIEPAMARLLLAEHVRSPFQGSILQLGKQTVLFGERQVRGWAEAAKATPGRKSDAPLHDEPSPAQNRNRNLDDQGFFQILGFDQVASCDVSGYENATFAVDLNQPVGQEFHARFDVIYDGGTMEHVFNVPRVLANIHSMLKVGGRVIHVVPSSNMVDHGFYSFSPTLFRDYYTVNNYLLIKIYLFECASWSGEWTVYDCSNRHFDSRLGRTASAAMAGVFCVAEKTANSTADVVPAQGHFSNLWTTVPNVQRIPPQDAWKLAFKSTWPRLTEVFFRTRALAWRVPALRRAALPPLVGKY